MLKHVKLFESFITEAQAEVISTKTIKLDKSIQEEIELAGELAVEMKKMADEFEEKIKPMRELFNKYDTNILEKLTSLNVNQAKSGKIIAKVMMSKGRLTDSYKTLWEEALKKFNAATQKAMLALQMANKKQNPDKHWMEYTKESMTNEGLKDIKDWGSKLVNKVKTWATDVWAKVKDALTGHEKAVNDLELVAQKITKK